ncbi:MAG: uroporphyrinogen-III synthase [Rhodoferax sp.]|nr:uroporphyrinogen-III synthase [Rhodoferax sp.]
MRVLVTRPQREAQKLVDALRALGFDAFALPLIDVSGPPDLAAVARAWQQIAEFDAVMFVSGNAVEQFFALKPPSNTCFTAQSPNAVRAFVTGPGSQSALSKAGVRAQWVDAPDAQAEQFDSEALWQVVHKQIVPGFRLLIVRGSVGDDTPSGAGRDWFAAQVQAAGGQVDYVVAYQRDLPQWTPELFTLAAQAAEEGAVWLFSSSQAISNLTILCPALSWERAHAVVTHCRIGQTAREAGFGTVVESRPSTPALVASIESLQ